MHPNPIPKRGPAIWSSILLISLAAAGCTSSSEPILPFNEPASLDLFVSAPIVTVGQIVEFSGIVRNSAGDVLPAVDVHYSIDDLSVVATDGHAEITALKPGTVSLSATSGPFSSSVRLTVVPPDTSAPRVWDFCVNEGSSCDFMGLHAVRLGAANGPFVQQTAFHTVPCAVYGFGEQNPSPNQALHCDVGPLLDVVLNNPSIGAMGLGSTLTVPRGSSGSIVRRVRASTDVSTVTDGSGSFRTTCELSNVSFDDPIAFPGRPGASHLHVFFGNTAVRATTTPDAVASSGSSTCRGGIVNRTAYWVPAMIDSRNGEVQVPDDGIFYYKSGYNMDPSTIRPFPTGLRMIAGDKASTTAQFNVDWGCRVQATASSTTIPTSCPSDDYVRLEVRFPQCWDGTNLDSPDHKSHMAFPEYRNPPQRSTCPATHPIPLPAITEKFDYPVSGKNTATWRLSSDMYGSSLAGGLSAHADWMNGWEPSVMKQIVAQCIGKGVDCGVASLGNGTELY